MKYLKVYEGNLVSKEIRIGIVVARFNQVLYAIFVDMQSLPGALYPEHQCRHREPQPEVEDHAQKPQRNIEHAAHETAGRIHCTALLMYCLFINKKLVLGNSLLFCN